MTVSRSWPCRMCIHAAWTFSIIFTSLYLMKYVWRYKTTGWLAVPVSNLPTYVALPRHHSSTLANMFTEMGGLRCYKPGTASISSKCNCHQTWTGIHCSVPQFVAESVGFNRFNISLRRVPRRVVCLSFINHEIEMFEVRVHELEQVCDVFVIAESNYTFHGDKKPLHLLNYFRKGWLSHLQQRVLYVFINDFAAGSMENGWLEQDHLRYKLGEAMMRRVRGYQPEDLIIYTDIDEIPRQTTVMFLKLHDGYTVPFGWWMRWSLYGYFGRMPPINRFSTEQLLKMGGSTVDMFSKTFGNSTAKLRAKTGKHKPWFIGSSKRYPSLVAGWHCSWCGSVEEIQRKVFSSPSGDGPRWGEKRNMTLEYLSNLVARGLWFDEAPIGWEHLEPEDDTIFAPASVLENRETYKYFVYNLYKKTH